jgi:hypothetical protein
VSGPLRDMKEALSNRRKPDVTHVRLTIKNYISRANEYGNVKGYERGNFLRPSDGIPHDVPNAADFRRLREYLRAMMNHADLVLNAMELHEAMHPQIDDDIAAMKAACFCPDDDQPPNGFPPSMLPHLAACAASLNIALEQAALCNLLPRDPGRPWESVEPEALPPLPHGPSRIEIETSRHMGTEPPFRGRR